MMPITKPNPAHYNLTTDVGKAAYNAAIDDYHKVHLRDHKLLLSGVTFSDNIYRNKTRMMK